MHYYLPNAIDLTGVYLTKQRKQELTGNSRRLTDDTADGEDQATSELGTELGLQSLYSSIQNNSQVCTEFDNCITCLHWAAFLF